MKPLLIAIDGPAGAGKTTVSRSLAEALGYTYVDTGALYRGVALAAIRNGISADDEAGLKTLLHDLRLSFYSTGHGLRLMMNGEDITDKIRTPDISRLSSAVSALPMVRIFLIGLQHRLAEKRNAIFEGRDMGTVVFPHADIKFFLTADIRARAKRRQTELNGRSSQTLTDVLADIHLRDRNDSEREISPLKAADDAIVIDSTNLSLEEVVHTMLSIIRTRFQ